MSATSPMIFVGWLLAVADIAVRSNLIFCGATITIKSQHYPNSGKKYNNKKCLAAQQQTPSTLKSTSNPIIIRQILNDLNSTIHYDNTHQMWSNCWRCCSSYQFRIFAHIHGYFLIFFNLPQKSELNFLFTSHLTEIGHIKFSSPGYMIFIGINNYRSSTKNENVYTSITLKMSDSFVAAKDKCLVTPTSAREITEQIAGFLGRESLTV